MAITYDLNKAGQDYTALYNKIKSLGTAHHAMQNLWLLDTTSSLASVGTSLSNVMDKNDSLFICLVTKDSHTGRLTQSTWDWLKSHL